MPEAPADMTDVRAEETVLYSAPADIVTVLKYVESSRLPSTAGEAALMTAMQPYALYGTDDAVSESC